MASLRCTALIITLTTKGLNISIKRQRLAKWIRKHDSTTLCLQETNFNYYSICRLKVKK